MIPPVDIPNASQNPEHVPASNPGQRAGDVIDRYELIEEIGQGGMGSVWRAQQSEPVVRQVALKIIKLGMDTREVVARFEAERQALALMAHPHIAKVLDGGATDLGRPYFVMELVEGEPITHHCDRARLELRERLELFVKVCAGIQHAHQKGLIHRDIKPGNVLVALQDGEPVPKVIDFGIAKATGAELSQKAVHTQLGQLLGTPEYMAPEQFGVSGLDIDTRADVYSLGVLLYELLTGTKPFDIGKLIETGYDEALRTIRDEEPVKPSTRVTQLGDDTPTVADRRRLDAGALRKRLIGDLDWIVMKSIEKDRSRRYESASGFAADVERFLNQEPVEAAPPSALYRFTKLVKRRKKTVAALTTISVLLVAGSIGTGVGLWRTIRANAALDVALNQKDAALAEKAAALEEEELQRTLAQENERRARTAEEDARKEAERATMAEADAQARAQELQQVASFQSSQLSELDPELMGVRLRRSLIDAVPEERRAALIESIAGPNFTSLALQSLEENLFQRSIEAIDEQFSGQPLVQAQLLATVAETLEQLGLFERASDPTQRALSIRRAELGDEHPDTLSSIDDMGGLLRRQGKLEEAELNCREALDGRRRVLGDQHPDTLSSLNNLGFLLHRQGRLDEAAPYYREALDGYLQVFGDEHPETLLGMNNMGNLMREQGRLDEAEGYFREALDGHRRVLGDEHPNTVASINNLGSLLWALGRPEESEQHFEEALETHRRVLGDEHPRTLLSLNNMGSLLRNQGRLVDAEPYLREALDGYRRVLGDEHPSTLTSMANVGFLLQAQGRLAEAEPYFREPLDGHRRALGDEHPSTLMSINNMGYLLLAQGRLEESETFYREALDGHRRVLGDDHPSTLQSVYNMGFLLEAQGRLEEAEPYVREAIDGRLRVLGDEHPDTLRSIRSLGSLLESRVTAARQQKSERHLGSTLADLGAFLVRDGASAAAAEPVLGEALDLLIATEEEESKPQRVLSDLGAALALQGRLADAEPLLAESAEWMLANPTDPMAGTALQRMVDLYDAWHVSAPQEGHDAQAADWRREFERWQARHGE